MSLPNPSYDIWDNYILEKGLTPDNTSFPETPLGFSDYLTSVGIFDLPGKVSFDKLLVPNNKEVAKRLGYLTLLPPREEWNKAAALILLWEELALAAGSPGGFRNWWRPAAYNNEVSGAAQSDHLSATAFDVDWPNETFRRKAYYKLKEEAATYPWLKISIGTYEDSPGALHFGIGSPAGAREWGYEGKRVISTSSIREPETLFRNLIYDNESYRNFVKGIEKQGWTFYDKDVTLYNVFYKEREMRIPTTLGGKGFDHNKTPLVATSLQMSLGNLFAQLPIAGSYIPTAQYLGKRDDTLQIEMECIGLNHLKEITALRDLLRSQAIQFKSIRDCWYVNIENPLVNATGNSRYIITGLDSSTIPGQVNHYGMEMRLEAAPPILEPTNVRFVGVSKLSDLRKSFWRELFERDPNGSALFEKNEKGELRAKTEFFSGGNSIHISSEIRTRLQKIAAAVNLANRLFILSEKVFPKDSPEYSSDLNKRRLDRIKEYCKEDMGIRPESCPFVLNGQEMIWTSFGRKFLDDFNVNKRFPYLKQGDEIFSITVPILGPVISEIEKPIFVEGPAQKQGDFLGKYERKEKTSLDAPSIGVIPFELRKLKDEPFDGADKYSYIDGEYKLHYLIPSKATRAKMALLAFVLKKKHRVYTGQWSPVEVIYTQTPSIFPGIDYLNLLESRTFPSFADNYKQLSADFDNVEEERQFIKETDFLFDLDKNLWSEMALAYLINDTSAEDIRLITSLVDMEGNFLFPDTRRIIDWEIMGSSGRAYMDLELPLHPYWSSSEDTRELGAVFTDPDFYIYNAGAEGRAEHGLPSCSVDNDRRGQAANPEKMNNRIVAIAAETVCKSMENMAPNGEVAPTSLSFSAPFEAANPFEGDSMRLDFEYGFRASWSSLEENNGEIRSQKIQNNETAKKRDAESTGNAVRHSSMDVKNAEEKSDPSGPGEGSGDGSEGGLAPNQMSAGAKKVAEAQSVPSENRLSWREIVPLFGPNMEIPGSPTNVDWNHLKTLGEFNNIEGGEAFRFWNFDAIPPGQFLSDLANDRIEKVYNFNVEAWEKDSESEFKHGNWGDQAALQFSNNRYALYGKIRDAFKSLGTKKWLARRAFPTFKLFIIEDDENGDWLEFDDFYTYAQIESISISDSRKRPASVCVISMLNTGGALDGSNMWNKAARLDEVRDPHERRKLQRQRDLENASGNAEGTEFEQDMSDFILQEGAKIKVKMGFSNNPDRLTDSFLGEVTEVHWEDDGNRLTIIAQSFGTELVAHPKGTTVSEVSKTYVNTFDVLAHLMFEPEVIHFGRKRMGSVSMVGEDQSLERNEIIHRNTIGRNFLFRGGPQGWLIGGGESILNNMRNYINKSMNQVRVQPLAGPQDDNIYAPHFSEIQRYYWYSWYRNVKVELGLSKEIRETLGANIRGQAGTATSNGNGDSSNNRKGDTRFDGKLTTVSPNYKWLERFKPAELEYNIFYSSIWDVFDEMTLRHPGFVKHPRMYGNSNRMTMFFGLPDQYYWYKAPSIGSVSRANELWDKIIKSGKEEINSEIRENSSSTMGILGPATFEVDRTTRREEYTFSTKEIMDWIAIAQKRRKPFRSWHHINSSTDIVANNMVANKHGFYTAAQIQFMGSSILGSFKGALKDAADEDNEAMMNPNSFVEFSDSDVEEIIAQRDLSPDYIRSVFHKFPNCRGRIMARRYGRALLARYARDMYKGGITIIGNPEINPYDVVVINDVHNQISGPIEVEEVIHTFNSQTGFTTEIIPDTFIIHEDITPMVIWEGILPNITIKTDRYIRSAIFSNSSDKQYQEFYDQVFSTFRDAAETDELLIKSAGKMSSDPWAITGFVSAAITGATTGAMAGAALGPAGAGVGSMAGGIGGFVGAIGMTAGAFVMNKWVQYYVYNYISNSKAYFMVPLIKKGRPWLAGFELTLTNTMYKDAWDVMKRWWTDGGEGINQAYLDAATSGKRVEEVYGDELTWLASGELKWSMVGPAVRRGLLF